MADIRCRSCGTVDPKAFDDNGEYCVSCQDENESVAREEAAREAGEA